MPRKPPAAAATPSSTIDSGAAPVGVPAEAATTVAPDHASGAGDTTTTDPVVVAAADADAQALVVAARAEALAKLASSDDDDEHTPGGGEDVPAPPYVSGEVHRWGGDVPHLVVAFMFNARDRGRTRTAMHGDVVYVADDVAARGVHLGVLTPYDTDDE